MLSISNIAIAKRNNKVQADGQMFQQSPFTSPVNLLPKQDMVSFGMSPKEISLEILSELRVLSRKLVTHINSGDDAKAIELINGLGAKSDELQNAFAMYKTVGENSHMGHAIVKRRPKVALAFLDFVANLKEKDHYTKEEFALLRNHTGDTHFTLALKEEQPDLATAFLEYAAGGIKNQARKKFVLSRDINIDNQFNVAVSLGYYEHAMQFLDLVKNIGGKVPAKFFFSVNRNGLLPIHFAQSTQNSDFIDGFLGFCQESITKEDLQERGHVEFAKIEAAAMAQSLFPLGQLLQEGRVAISK